MTEYTTAEKNIETYLNYMVEKVRKDKPANRQEFLCWQRRVKLAKEIRDGVLEYFKDEHSS